MEYPVRRSQGGIFEGIYKLIMRRNSIYVTFVIAGAFAGERAVDYGVRKLWEYNNVGVGISIIVYISCLVHVIAKEYNSHSKTWFRFKQRIIIL
ncbi:Ubiquinol-cytochrome c reductase complex 8.0 kDa protein, putative [Ricinus communis]|uniref:Complex III subunit 9 n=1 Tax=Ricinus communis TaxID=3988 RepID=B9SRX5_RICCO|nr:Ubiquinol-cytochrome c reductase complex 8.0 kDa protein, putative [Ricinus communis]